MNILVTDDEPLIHISIEKLIQSCSDDYTVYHAYNGHEMLDILKEHPFFLALVDIKMPGISGLESIKLAKEISPMTRYYIMTGFDEFEYAKQAIKLKVDDYLMKPLDLKTIQETIQAAKQLDYTSKRERKTIFRNWLESSLNHREGSLEKYSNYYCSLILVSIDNPAFPKETLLEKLMPYNDNFVSSFAGSQILLLCFCTNADFLRCMQKELAAQTYTDGITLFISSIARDTSQHAKSLQLLLHYSCLRVLMGIEKVYHLKPLMGCDSELFNFCQLCLSWQSAFNEKNYNKFMNLSSLICNRLENQPIWQKYMENIKHFFLLTLSSFPPLPDQISELHRYFYECAKTLLHTPEKDTLIESIIQYIHTHYCDNISTANLSAHFGLSANYISNLLKQELGIRYNDYITQLRLNHAKELLISTKQSVKEITSACGYYSQSHFTKLFIEHENCTPTEYRKRNSLN